MFYNRFGKCNRGDKCPYIHDPDKIAVCTRYVEFFKNYVLLETYIIMIGMVVLPSLAISGVVTTYRNISSFSVTMTQGTHFSVLIPDFKLQQ